MTALSPTPAWTATISSDNRSNGVSVGFSPSGTAIATIVAAIDSASQRISVAAYAFTSKKVAAALTRAHLRGITVQLVADKKAASDKYTAVTFLANKGVAVRLNNRYAIMHNKFMVIDGRTVQTGSFNYSNSADRRNAENVLVLWNAPEVANEYQKEFERLWQEGQPLAKAY
ncbi:phospholipase D family nuclease [Biostraticola tofi]|uniref:phospholipase D n=1 Tax=Biostraticola tofi TaxID=466109 RepID=A0A4R3Z4B4_9GAMM|nr:phospholipase D family protein [Biostraticola tofi]TCV98748.1 phospholipase D-like protein [Biostraticola tofi]